MLILALTGAGRVPVSIAIGTFAIEFSVGTTIVAATGVIVLWIELLVFMFFFDPLLLRHLRAQKHTQSVSIIPVAAAIRMK
jgi:hypothetical protein